MAAIRQRIAGRALTPGGEAALDPGASPQTMQVSTSTVVEAYDRLAAEGVIRSRPGSGFYVAGAAGAAVARRDRRRGSTAPSIRSGCRGSRWKPAPRTC